MKMLFPDERVEDTKVKFTVVKETLQVGWPQVTQLRGKIEPSDGDIFILLSEINWKLNG